MYIRYLLFHLIFFVDLIYANPAYDENLLKLQSIAYPKLITADKNLKNKLRNNNIELSILYDEIDILSAKRFKKFILKNYTELNGYPLDIKLLEYSHFNFSKELSSAYIFLKSDRENINKIASFLNKKSIITFSYDPQYIEYGVLMSLEINSKTDLVIKKEQLKNSKINFKNIIFQVVKLR